MSYKLTKTRFIRVSQGDLTEEEQVTRLLYNCCILPLRLKRNSIGRINYYILFICRKIFQVNEAQFFFEETCVSSF